MFVYRVVTGKRAFLRRATKGAADELDDVFEAARLADLTDEELLDEDAAVVIKLLLRRVRALEENTQDMNARVNALNIWAGHHWHRDKNGKDLTGVSNSTPGDTYNEQNSL